MAYNPEIFKDYDIRGVYDKDLDNNFAFKLGSALVKYLGRKTLLIGHDNRDFSLNLAQTVITGLHTAGNKCEYLGNSTTPFFNYVLNAKKMGGGVMITASHNAPEYAGFKLFGARGRAIFKGSGLEDLQQYIEADSAAVGFPKVINFISKRLELQRDYIKFLIKKAHVKQNDLEKVRVKISGPDTTLAEVEQLKTWINLRTAEAGYDLSFIFDEDADRVYIFDKDNNPVRADFIVGLLAKDAVRFLKRPRVVHDLRFSRGVTGKLNEWGIKTIISRVGRTFIKELMVKNRADLGGELSGHIYFKETYYNEAPLLTLLEITGLMAKSGMAITELIRSFQTWHNSGEINFRTSPHPKLKPRGDEENEIREKLNKLKSKYSDGETNELDGLTIYYPDWWFNIRPSHTEPLLRLTVEAKEKNLLEQKVNEISPLLR